MRPAIGGEKAVLSPQSSILSPQSSEMPKNNVFSPKNLIYGILVANVLRIPTTHFEDKILEQVRP